METATPLRHVADLLLKYPSLWPLWLLPLPLALVAALAKLHPSRRIFPLPPWIFLAGSLFCIGCFVFTAWTYQRSSAFWDLFECREASVATLWLRGGAVYPDLGTEERYCPPYGPMLYMTLGCSQWLFGASVFSTKLPCVLAALGSLALFWVIARRQYASASNAMALTGLLAALLLVFRQLTFWSKSDSLIIFTVVLGLFAALRRGGFWSVLLGCCLGCAVDLKLHAAAYFLPSMVIGFRNGWRVRAFSVCGLVAAFVATLPFMLQARQFPLGSYLAFLKITALEGFGWSELVGFGRWMLLLIALVYVADRLTGPAREWTPEERRLRLAYRAALALAMLLVAVPGCAVGAGQGHLAPLLPSFLLALGDHYSGGGLTRWRRSPGKFWEGLACSGLLAALLVSFQTASRMKRFQATTSEVVQACRSDLRRVLAKFGASIILTGAGDDEDHVQLLSRHEAVFAGHPIGIDMAAMMDYQRSNVAEPDMVRLLTQLQVREHKSAVWLLPRGSVPFSTTNIYDSSRLVYSDRFRREFHQCFELREQTDFYDLYFPQASDGPEPESYSR